MDDEQSLRPWAELTSASREPADRGGDEFAALVTAQRLVQARVAGVVAGGPLLDEVTRRLNELATLLGDHQGAERERFDGRRPELPGRGSPVQPPYVIDSREPGRLSGRVTFSRFYLGGNGAVHGGSQPLLFDDLLGWIVQVEGAPPARTVRLEVNYRRITPIGVELAFEATLDEITGRKRYASARLHDDSGALCAEAAGLFVELRPGQA